MSEEQVGPLLDSAGLKSYTEHTVTSRKALLTQLVEARNAGFATAYEELETGLNSAAAPVRDHTGAVVAALVASGPAYRFDKARIEEIRDELKEAGDRVSQRMGWLG